MTIRNAFQQNQGGPSDGDAAYYAEQDQQALISESFRVEDHGTLAVVTPLTCTAAAFVNERVEVPSYLRVGNGGFACEPRFVESILDGFATFYEQPNYEADRSLEGGAA